MTKRAFVCASLCLLTALAPLTFAQTTTGSIEGFVLDGDGIAIRRVEIVVSSASVSFNRGSLTSDTGYFRVSDLPVGTYDVEYSHVSFLNVVIEAVSRLIPGVLGNPESTAAESFQTELLEGPQYTRPAEFRGIPVPEVLRSGDHGKIARWRQEQARERTRRLRPDLLDGPAKRGEER